MNPFSITSERRQDLDLTARELQVIELVGAGYTNKDLARLFAISENAVQNYLNDVYNKLGVSNRIELLLFAADQGLNSEA